MAVPSHSRESSSNTTSSEGASFDIDWSLLDASITESVVDFLSSAFASAKRPSYLGEIQVNSFSFGDTSPEVQLLHIGDVWKEFVQDDDDEFDSPLLPPPDPYFPSTNSLPDHASFHSQPEVSRGTYNSYFSGDAAAIPSTLNAPVAATPQPSAPSLQVHLRVVYTGNLHIGLATSLLINYPSSNFMSLPLKLHVTSLAFTGIFMIAYEGDRRRVHLSIQDPGHDNRLFTPSSKALSPGSRLLTDAVVESEVGQADKHVLKNVGKVEKFVLDVMRNSMESELVFPNFQTILF